MTDDVISWCKNLIRTIAKNIENEESCFSKTCEKVYNENSKNSINKIFRKEKKWHIKTDGCTITVNAYSYTIITAHKLL